jgi:hypothetical protein
MQPTQDALRISHRQAIKITDTDKILFADK